MRNFIKNRCCIPSAKIETDSYDWWDRHEEKCKLVLEKKFDIIFFGDSITHFWSKENNVDYGEGHWDEVFAGKSVLNLGFGYDRIQNVLWRITNGELANQEPKVIVVNIGTNQYLKTPNYPGDNSQDTAEGITFLIKKLHEEYPDTKIIVMTIFPRGSVMKQVIETNALLHKLLPAIPNVDLVDIFDRFLKKDASEPTPDPQYYQKDLCHLNRRGYELWYEAVKKYF